VPPAAPGAGSLSSVAALTPRDLWAAGQDSAGALIAHYACAAP
jgi:hypothetical protein